MTPGKQKRGKAAKQAIEVFSRARDTPPSHKGLIKGVTDNECVQAMIGDVKVAVAGLAQATQVRYSTVTKCDKNSYPTLSYPTLRLRAVPYRMFSYILGIIPCKPTQR